MDCIFCKIIEGKIKPHIVYQDDFITCFLDIDPINQGHVLIIPNNHYVDVDELPNETWMAIMSLSQVIVRVVKERYSPDGYSMMQNGGIFNDIGHYHLHIFPRYRNDGFGWTFRNTAHAVSKEIADELKVLLYEQNRDSCKGLS